MALTINNCRRLTLLSPPFVEPALPFVDAKIGWWNSARRRSNAPRHRAQRRIACRHSPITPAIRRRTDMFDHHARSITTAALLSAVLATIPFTARAETPSVVVHASDLNLATNAGRTVLQNRIALAVEKVCDPVHGGGAGKIGAADTQPAPVTQLRVPGPGPIVPETDNPVAAGQRGAMKAHKLRRVQLALQFGDGLMEQKRARAHMQPHIIALRFDQIDIPGGDADDFRAVRHPELLGPG